MRLGVEARWAAAKPLQAHGLRPESFLDEQMTLTDWPNDFPAACQYLRDSPFLLQLASAVPRREMSFCRIWSRSTSTSPIRMRRSSTTMTRSASTPTGTSQCQSVSLPR